MPFRLLWPLLLAALLGGCATTSISVAPGADAHRQPDGSVQIVSEKTSRVAVRLLAPVYSQNVDQVPAFEVSVTNRSSAAVGFGPENVTASLGEKPVRLYTLSDYSRAIHQAAEYEQFLAVGRGIAAIRSAQEGPLGLGGAKPMVAARVGALDQQTDAVAKARRQLATLSSMLAPSLVAPGASVTGIVRLHPEDLRAGGRLKLVIAMDGEPHEFSFEIGN